MRRSLPLLMLLAAALCLAGAPRAHAQDAAHSVAPEVDERAASVVLRASARATNAPSVGVGDVGAELLGERPLRSYRQERAAVPLQNEVTTAALKRGALIGGGIGLATGAAVGALLGGDRNSRVETAIPGALTGLAVGAPVGVYLHTDRAPTYLWGAASAVGAVGLASLIFLAE